MGGDRSRTEKNGLGGLGGLGDVERSLRSGIVHGRIPQRMIGFHEAVMGGSVGKSTASV